MVAKIHKAPRHLGNFYWWCHECGRISNRIWSSKEQATKNAQQHDRRNGERWHIERV